MTPSLQLLPKTVIWSSGVGPTIGLPALLGNKFTLHITIHRILERENVDLSLWASEDGQDWGDRAVLRLPRRYHCGSYQVTLDRSEFPRARFVRLSYQLNPGTANHHSMASLEVSLDHAERAMATAR